MEGWVGTETFTDNNRSASRFVKAARGEFERLLRFLDAGRTDILVLWESSRGSRELEEWAGLLNLCRRQGVRIHVLSHRRTYDLNTPRDWRTLAEDGVDSAYESEKTRERILRNVRSNAAKGRPHGRLLYGYQRVYDPVTRALVEQRAHPVHASLVQEAARRISDGESCRSVALDFNARGISAPHPGWDALKLNRLIMETVADRADLRAEVTGRIDAGETVQAVAADLTARGIPVPWGGRWDGGQIKRIVTNPGYVGQRVLRGKVVGQATWKGIIDPATFAVCVARLSDPDRRTVDDSTVKYLVSGIAMCDVCGSRMSTIKNRGYRSYICKGLGDESKGRFCTSVVTRKLDEFVEQVVVNRLSRPDCLELLAGDGGESIRAAAAEAADLRQELNGWVEAAKGRRVTPASFAEIEAGLLQQIEAAERRARRVQIPPIIKQVAGPDAAQRWQALTIAKRREVVNLLCEIRIRRTRQGARVLDPERVVINWR